MIKYTISKIRQRYIIPFEFEMNTFKFEEACLKVDDFEDSPFDFIGDPTCLFTEKSKLWKRSNLKNGEQDLYEFIIDEFSDITANDGSSKKQGCFWKYEYFKNKKIDLYFLNDEIEKNKNNGIHVSIVEMGLYIFRSGIGFLWYEIGMEDSTINDSKKLIDYQIQAKLTRGKERFWIFRDDYCTSLNIEQEQIPFDLSSWAAVRLSFLGIRFQDHKQNGYHLLLGNELYSADDEATRSKNIEELERHLPSSCPRKPLLFSYNLFEKPLHWKKDENAVRTAYYLTNGYNERYEMEKSIKTEQWNPFGNIIWMAGREGCSCCSWSDKNNKYFFENILYYKIMDDYFILYIRALYESLSFMRFSRNIYERLPCNSEVYWKESNDIKDLNNSLSSLIAEINLFLAKSMITSVSNVNHQNDFYSYVCDRLYIGEDSQNVTSGMAALKELQKETIKRMSIENDKRKEELMIEEQQREKESDNAFQKGLGLMTFLVVISAVTDAYGIISSLANNVLESGAMVIFIIVSFVCLCILGVSLRIFVKTVRNDRKKKSTENNMAKATIT